MNYLKRAFSLFELLITLSLIALLGSLTWPSYREHIRHTRRLQAKLHLQQLASNLEAARIKGHMAAQPTTDNPDYQFQVDQYENGDYLIKAIPKAAQRETSSTLTLDSHGVFSHQ